MAAASNSHPSALTVVTVVAGLSLHVSYVGVIIILTSVRSLYTLSLPCFVLNLICRMLILLRLQ